MGGKRYLVVFCLLTACCSHQDRIDDATIVCRDGVEYLAMGAGGGRTITPHMKPDGKVFTCERVSATSE